MRGHLLFVYGTLKRGFPNHHYLSGAEFLGRARTLERYTLYVDRVPYVVREEKVSFIKGEVYRVSDDILKRVDMLEGHPTHYRRERVKIVLENRKVLEAWIYFYPKPVGRLEPSGEYT